MEKVALGVQNP